jgi:hypothetical protein
MDQTLHCFRACDNAFTAPRVEPNNRASHECLAPCLPAKTWHRDTVCNVRRSLLGAWASRQQCCSAPMPSPVCAPGAACRATFAAITAVPGVDPGSRRSRVDKTCLRPIIHVAQGITDLTFPSVLLRSIHPCRPHQSHRVILISCTALPKGSDTVDTRPATTPASDIRAAVNVPRQDAMCRGRI